VSAAVAIAGWLAAVALAFELRRRAALLADAAHELRGPLTAISLGLEALRRHPVARRRADALAVELLRMQAAAEDVSAAGRGRRAGAAVRPVLLREMVERSGEAWRPAAVRRGGRVVFDWPTGAGAVRADPRRLAQAFGNLLANAIEHGGGEVVVRGRPLPGAIRVEVEDRGSAAPVPPPPPPGTASARRDRGRGLAIAARGIDGAGGRLEARERPGGGRLAVAEFPLDEQG
jgi:signal transduction histidine kinase